MKSQTFRKFAVLLAAFTLVSVFTFAGKVSNATSSTIREAIWNSVKDPAITLLQDNNATADVLFSINDKGMLVVDGISSKNEELSDYLLDRLSKVNFADLESQENQRFHIKLTFLLK